MAGEISIDIDVTDKSKSGADLQMAMDMLDSVSLLIGIPEENAGGSSGGLNNVQLAYLHSRGSPVNKMPARPFIEPAIEQKGVLDKIAGCFGRAFEAAILGDAGTMRKELEFAGIYGSNAVKAYMGSAALAPNAPITVSGGWMRNKVSGKPVYVKGKGSAAPLIDTGSLRAAVTYVLDEGGGK